MDQSNPIHGLPLSVPTGTITLSAAALHLYDQSKLIEQDAIQKMLQIERLQASLENANKTAREEIAAKQEAVAGMGKWMAYWGQKRDEADAAKQESLRLGREVEGLQVEKSLLEAKVRKLEAGEAEVRKLRAEIETLQDDKTSLAAKACDVEAALEVVEAKKRDSEASLTAEIQQLKDRIAVKTTEAFSLRSDLEEAKDLHASVQAGKTTALQAVVETTKRNNELSHELECVKQQLECQSQAAERTAQRSKTQYAELEQQLSLVVSDKISLQGSLHDAEVSTTRLEADKQVMEGKLADAEATVKWLRTMNDVLEGDLRQTQTAADGHSRALKLSKVQLKKCSQENAEIHSLQQRTSAELQTEQGVKAMLSEQVSMLESQLDAGRQRVRTRAESTNRLLLAYRKAIKHRATLICVASFLSDEAGSFEQEVDKQKAARFVRRRLQSAQLVSPTKSDMQPDQVKQEEFKIRGSSTLIVAKPQGPVSTSPRTPPPDGARVKFSLPKSSSKTAPIQKQTTSPLMKRKQPVISLDPRLQKKMTVTTGTSAVVSTAEKRDRACEQELPVKRECRRDYWSCCKDHL